MLQLYPVYSLWNRHKTLTGSLDPMHANGTNKPCNVTPMSGYNGEYFKHVTPVLGYNGEVV